ncbi:MAG: hypothetical protein ACLS7Q_03420 [Varibaculum cambriense]
MALDADALAALADFGKTYPAGVNETGERTQLGLVLPRNLSFLGK